MLKRRSWTFATAAFVFAPALHLGVRAQGRQRPTPRQTEGPFYPLAIPEDDDADLLLMRGRAPYAHGEPAWLAGTLADLDGRPVAGGAVEIWQCDHAGHYHHPGDGGRADPSFQGFGRATVGADGRFRFHTLKPVPYSGRTPHIHLKAKLGARELLTTQLYVEGEPRNERDGLWRSLRDPADRAALTRTFRREADGWHVEFPIFVAA